MRVSDLDFDLPGDRIAQRPTDERDGARLLHLLPDNFDDGLVRDLAARIPRGALVVVNDTRVLRARLIGTRAPSGGRAEIFLLKKLSQMSEQCAHYEALGKASKPLRVGTTALFGEKLVALVTRSPSKEIPTIEVELRAPNETTVDAEIERLGHVPLPPYVQRSDDEGDRDRYQTLFARAPGAVAAPTAGLHISQRILDDLALREVRVAHLTLHIGLGTFQPVKVDDLDDHVMHSEWFEIGTELEQEVRAARLRGAPVVAIGTTVVRALESSRHGEATGAIVATKTNTNMLIQPGYDFGVVDMLLTNFHLPRSTLLALVCAFGGTRRVLAAYRHAVTQNYRFFSYGDAMLLSRHRQ